MEAARLQAANAGDKHYDGSPCKTCGSTLRYVTTGACVQCTKAKSIAHRIKVQAMIRQAREGV